MKRSPHPWASLAAGFLALAGTLRAAEPAASTPRIDPELVDRQPAMIDAAIDAMAGHSSPAAQVYFLGFAGFGEERVFAEEIDLAARRIADRYDTANRSMRLVNDRRDLQRWPLASVAALRYALQALARVMDEDDVLFLALSSHGLQNASLSISNSGMRPDELSADALAAALEDSGIRWRVIVISACYSGSFIEALANDHSIVITAAARDRASFGCSDERHLTWFGESFYQNALPRSQNLRQAFTATRAEIGERERQEKLRPSLPQASFGPLLEPRLEQMATQPGPAAQGR